MLSNAYMPEGNLISTNENREFLSSTDQLERAMREGRILEAPAVRCSNYLDLTVDLGCATGIINRDEVVFDPDDAPVKDIAVITRVGKPVAFKVTSMNGGKIRLSRKEAMREAYINFISGLTPGDIINAKVTHLEHFGAFVDIGCGFISLLPIDCVSVSRISHPRDRLCVGSEFRVVVRSVDRDENGKPIRIYVSRRELLGTWQENASLFEAGQTVTGIVRSIESYGVFIELAPNLAGLAEYRGDLVPGQGAAVYIKSIIPEKMKIKLAIVDSCRTLPPQDNFNSFIPESQTHISYWRYSPDPCPKLIESVF